MWGLEEVPWPRLFLGVFLAEKSTLTPCSLCKAVTVLRFSKTDSPHWNESCTRFVFICWPKDMPFQRGHPLWEQHFMTIHFNIPDVSTCSEHWLFCFVSVKQKTHQPHQRISRSRFWVFNTYKLNTEVFCFDQFIPGFGLLIQFVNNNKNISPDLTAVLVEIDMTKLFLCTQQIIKCKKPACPTYFSIVFFKFSGSKCVSGLTAEVQLESEVLILMTYSTSDSNTSAEFQVCSSGCAQSCTDLVNWKHCCPAHYCIGFVLWGCTAPADVIVQHVEKKWQNRVEKKQHCSSFEKCVSVNRPLFTGGRHQHSVWIRHPSENGEITNIFNRDSDPHPKVICRCRKTVWGVKIALAYFASGRFLRLHEVIIRYSTLGTIFLFQYVS